MHSAATQPTEHPTRPADERARAWAAAAAPTTERYYYYYYYVGFTPTSSMPRALRRRRID